ncbi:hypothetical protein CPT_Mendera_234 [Stenotrophomonas phage Mendera]|uniref:Carboxypeptidase regulatory-like domain-containing protein n=1 Tax=Stenotrophomonas phage Mendera TaxID=2650877 RepID=A0A5P8PL56_9CAUD|nr:hypothetical protein HWC60_gp181 [Stenotrophomonas phage Mendera]QFR56760.1 hypothetical protein CPT_Mendera_234 [Stenotrophomonas phage Mendera]
MADVATIMTSIFAITPGLDTPIFIPREMTGDKTISGRVMTGTKPMAAQVALLTHDTGVVVRKTTTNTNGEYAFAGLSDRFSFDVIAYDPVSKWEGKVSTKRIAG